MAGAVKRKIVPNLDLDLTMSLSPASSVPDLLDLDGPQTPDDLDDSTPCDFSRGTLHDDALCNSVFGPDLDWEGLCSLQHWLS